MLVTRYAYDEQGNKIAQTDALNRTTTWAYDTAGRVIRRTLPLGQSEETRYDSYGRIDWHTDFNGQLTRYVHDSDNRLTNTFYADGTELVITYDRQSRPLTLSRGGITETRRYDLRGRMDQVKWSDGQQIDYSYDAAGNRTSVVTGTRTVNFGFDTLNRLQTVTEVASAALGQSGAAKVTTYGYDGVGNRDHVIHANGTRVDYRYDRMNRLTSLVHSKGAAVLLALGYTLNPDGTRTQIAEQVQQRDSQGRYVVDGQGQPVLDATRTTSYDYDATKRLVEEAVTSATPGYERLTTWTYDSVGNRLSQLMAIPGGSLPNNGTVPASTTTTSYRYDANDRLLDETAVSNGVTRLTTHRYDLNGSLVETIAPDATTRYRYDGRNKLAQAERQVGSVLDITQYTYNHDGIRRSQIQKAGTLDAKEVRYLIDPNQAYAQVIEERVGSPLAPGANVSGLSLKAAYTYGDDLLGQYALRDMQGNLLPNVGVPSGTPNPVATASTFHYDGLGSTRLLTDAVGNLVDQYAYHAFGERDEWTSALASAQNPATDYQYTGEQFDPNLGFYYLRARYMDPGNGRFVQQDSWAGDSSSPVTLQKYLYANSGPTHFVDPSGYMGIHEQTATQNIESVLTVAARGDRILRMYDKINTLKELIVGIRRVIQYIDAGVPEFSSAFPENPRKFKFTDAAEKFLQMSGEGLSFGMADWVPNFAASLGRGRKLSSYILYMPTFGKFPSKLVASGVKIDGIPLKIGFGGPAGKFGSAMGLGLEMTKERQLMRMDYHTFNEGHGGASGVQAGEIKVLRDGNYHMHVYKWEGGPR